MATGRLQPTSVLTALLSKCEKFIVAMEVPQGQCDEIVSEGGG